MSNTEKQQRADAIEHILAGQGRYDRRSVVYKATRDDLERLRTQSLDILVMCVDGFMRPINGET